MQCTTISIQEVQEYTSGRISKVIMISVYHRDDTHSKVNKANKEETKPVTVHDYSWNITAIHFRDQLLHLHLPEQKVGSKWYMKLFMMLFNVVIYNSMIIYQSKPNNKRTDFLKFRLLLTKVSQRNIGLLSLTLYEKVLQPNCLQID